LIAFALYLVCSYFLLPLYRQRQRYAQYLPVALTASDQPGIISRTRLRVQEALADFAGQRIWRRRASDANTDLHLGDEELEEALHSEHMPRNAQDRGTERRLSRDLEAGFRDDSDEEDDAPRGVLGIRLPRR